MRIFFFLLLFFTNQKATVIAFSGISGCGKTTMAQLLAQELNAACILEPEEVAWPAIIKQREIYGYATALFAFRQIWAAQFIDAHERSKQSNLVFLDTYFFKIFGLYMDKPGMEWLIDPLDPYLSLLKELNALDRRYFPDADCVILFEVSCSDWAQFLQARSRNWDQIEQFAQSHARTSSYIEQATVEHCTQKNIPVIYFAQKFGDPDTQAQELQKKLKTSCVIP